MANAGSCAESGGNTIDPAANQPIFPTQKYKN
jgi:hypothetical protein